MRQLIPTNTKLTDEQLKMVQEVAIPERKKELGKLRQGDIEASLFLMDELYHLRELRDNNLNGTANEPHPSLKAQPA